MSSFYAELQVDGHTYTVRHCTYEFTQATGERGRPVAKVRHGVVRLTLDVPQDQVMLSWAAAAFKPLAGQVVFRDGKDGPALETLAWEAGHCVGYREEFVSGDTNAGAYVCYLTIAAPQLTMKLGGPAAYQSPAAGEHGGPQQAYLGAPLAVTAAAAAATAVETFVVPTFEQIAAAGLSALGRTALATATAGALPAALTLGLVLMPTNSRDDPGYAAEWDLYRRNQRHLTPVTPDQLRLAQLEQLHAQGDLTPEEEKELIALLGKVKGIHILKLSDLASLHQFNGHIIDLDSCPLEIPASASIIEQNKTGYDQVKFKWDDGAFGYEARWHTKTPGAPAEQGDTWVLTRTTPGNAQGQRKVQHILTGPNQWTPSHQWQSAVVANQSDSATTAQKKMLNDGHWAAHK